MASFNDSRCDGGAVCPSDPLLFTCTVTDSPATSARATLPSGVSVADGVMNEFVSWCRHLLVSFLFHALTSLHPPSFHRNDFSTCNIYLHTQ